MKTIVFSASGYSWACGTLKERNSPDSRPRSREVLVSDRGADKLGPQATERVRMCGDECGGS